MTSCCFFGHRDTPSYISPQLADVLCEYERFLAVILDGGSEAEREEESAGGAGER